MVARHGDFGQHTVSRNERTKDGGTQTEKNAAHGMEMPVFAKWGSVSSTLQYPAGYSGQTGIAEWTYSRVEGFQVGIT